MNENGQTNWIITLCLLTMGRHVPANTRAASFKFDFQEVGNRFKTCGEMFQVRAISAIQAIERRQSSDLIRNILQIGTVSKRKAGKAAQATNTSWQPNKRLTFPQVQIRKELQLT